jgi:hypothetical protein
MKNQKINPLPEGYKWVTLDLVGYPAYVSNLSERDLRVFEEDLDAFIQILASLFGLLSTEQSVGSRALFIASPSFNEEAYRVFVSKRHFHGLKLRSVTF